ncbi:GGDEF domain-containing protein, partial [Rhizobiaceae sp. 2RAB30]
MRLHKAESAFFVFIIVILAAGVVTFQAYGVLETAAATVSDIRAIAGIDRLENLLFATGVLLATALFFGIFFIYPLIRIQVKEEGKLREMTMTLSQRSETLQQAA